MTTADNPRLSRQTMCDRLAMEFQDGWIVNLGVGMPTLCSNYLECEPDKEIIFHSENGVIGYGPLAPAGEEDKPWSTPAGRTWWHCRAWPSCITPTPLGSSARAWWTLR